MPDKLPLLDSPEVAGLIADPEMTRWTSRPGYPIRSMVGLALVKSVYALPTWTRAVRLVADHAALRRALGAAPSVDAAYRFTVKLREHSAALADCLDRVLAGLGEAMPDMGRTVAIDGSDMPAYANGQRFVSKRRTGAGTLRRPRCLLGPPLVHLDPQRGRLLRLQVARRRVHHDRVARGLAGRNCPGQRDDHRDAVARRTANARLRDGHGVLDKGYDTTPIYDGCEERGIRPIIPLRQTPAVKAGKAQPPSCEHGVWTFAGSDAKRGASKWRCPTAECPASVWIKADRLHTLVPRGTDRFKAPYKSRAAVERELGRLKHEWGFAPLRVRRIERVRLHTDLTMLAQRSGTCSWPRGCGSARACFTADHGRAVGFARLTSALNAARAMPLAA